MAFPATPTNGQVHITSSGLKYAYSATPNSWSLQQGANLGKTNASSTVDPTTTDDNTSGYGVGSLWVNTTDYGYFTCTSAITGAAVWERTGFRPAHFVSVIPLLSVLPSISTVVPFTTARIEDMANVAGVVTIGTTGVYTINLTVPIENSNRRFLYTPTVFVNAVANPITGAFTGDKDTAGIRWPRVHSFTKTLDLIAGDTVEIRHITDDLLATYGADYSIVRIF